MNKRQKKKKCKSNIVNAVGDFFAHKIKTKHIRLMGVLNNDGYLYQHNGYEIRVTLRKEETENDNETE